MIGDYVSRGAIYYIYPTVVTGSEMIAGRPGVIVSNDDGNEHSTVVEVVFLTTREKSDIPTHVSINSTRKSSTALCEQVTTVDKTRIGDFIGYCSPQELEQIDSACVVSLGLNKHIDRIVAEKVKESEKANKKAEVSPQPDPEGMFYKKMYYELLDRVVASGK